MSNLALALNDSNYYSEEANLKYMSVSQYKMFLECEAATMAEIKGEYSRFDKEALVAGNYLHAWNEGVLHQFKLDNYNTIYNKKGEPYAAFKKADEMIQTLENDDFCMSYLQGDKEVIITAEYAGALWKAKIDVLNEDEGFFTDLKSTRSIRELHYSEKHRQKVSFIEEYDYLLQVAVYAELERISSDRKNWLEPVMVAVSKEDPPDKSVITLADEGRLNTELDNVEQTLPHILAVKQGFEEAKRCGKCRYCRMTNRVTNKIQYIALGGSMYGSNV